MTKLIICVYALSRNKHAKLYFPSTFQTSDKELPSPQIETEYTYISLNQPEVTILVRAVSDTTPCSTFMWIESLFFELSCT